MRHPNRLFAAVTLAAGLAVALVPRAARADAWSLTGTVWGGVSKYDVLGLKDGIANVQSQDRRDLMNGRFNSTGASAVLRLGWLDVGALYEGTWLRSRADSAVITPLVGFAIPLGESFRLDLLGELGGHRVSNIGTSGSFDASQAKSVWLPSVGLRPTLSYRLPVGPVHAVLQATPFARWDLVKKTVTVPVTVGGTTTQNTYDVGGTTFGVVGAIGVEL
jgi:hypothetical protein